MKQYIEKDRILAEIDKRMEELRPTNTHKMQTGEKVDRDVLMWLNALTWVKKFLNTLEAKEVDEEPVSEDLKQAIHNAIFALNERKGYTFKLEDMFMAGAQWQKEQIITKACEYLEENLLDFWSQKITNTDYFIEDFKQAMEE